MWPLCFWISTDVTQPGFSSIVWGKGCPSGVTLVKSHFSSTKAFSASTAHWTAEGQVVVWFVY